MLKNIFDWGCALGVKQIDKTVIKETGYITLWVLIFSTLMQAIFLILRRWDHTVLLGHLLGGGAAVLNFFLMGLTVQNALTKDDKDARTAMKVSQLYRNLLLLAVAVVGMLVPSFDAWTTIVPLLFPRIAIALRSLLKRTEQ